MQAKYLYRCAVCGSPAKKEPLLAHAPEEPADGTLGSWRCTGECKGKVRVKREKV